MRQRKNTAGFSTVFQENVEKQYHSAAIRGKMELYRLK